MAVVAAAAPYIALAAGGLQAIGSIRQGNAQAASARYNANLADQNAQIALQQGAENARRQRIVNTKQLGAIRANVGASGVTLDGSPLDVLEESARAAELDALSIEHQGQLQAWGYQNSASLYRQNARQALTGGYMGAAAALLKSGVNYAALSQPAAPTAQLMRYRGLATQAYENPDI